MKNKVLIVLLVLGLAMTAVFLTRNRPLETQRNSINEARPSPSPGIEVVASNLEIPWEVALINNSIFITERPGKLLKIDQNRQVIEIEGVTHVGEGGLLGLAIHPNFKENQLLFLYLTTRNGGQLVNQVERYRLVENKLVEGKVVISGIAGSAVHDGGRIVFGPDGYLYITTGDAGNPNLAQDKNSPNGKILRLKADGSVPPDNPFGNAVYSWGHRNPQGLTWDAEGNLWSTEHGPSGAQSGFDEINLIAKGKNYGWPIIKGEEAREGLTSPVIQSGATDTWAPAGVTFWDNSLFFGGLRGEALYEYSIKTGELQTHFSGEFGRIRAVVLGPDEYLYLTTSNRDGRGTVRQADDRLIRVDPQIFRLNLNYHPQARNADVFAG